MTRVGLLGGTFDPVHAGHLEIASHCRTALELDVVRFLANRRPPHKPAAHASDLHRHAMLALATAPEPGFVADPRELERPGLSYTAETLEEIVAEEPGVELFFLIGADSLRDLPSWHRAAELPGLATFVAVGRGGIDAEAALEAWRAEHPDVPADRVRLVEHEPPPWSSTELRAALAAGDPPQGAIPEPVLDYIRKHRLYVGPDSPRRNA